MTMTPMLDMWPAWFIYPPCRKVSWHGADRTKFNHLKSKFMCLCEYGVNIEVEKEAAAHHKEAHQLGLTAFCNKYHVKPIKLSQDDLTQLGIQGNYES